MSATNTIRRWVAGLKNTGVTKLDLNSGDAIKLLPQTDDTGKLQFGDGTNDMDVEVYLGDTTKKVVFDVGNSQVTLGTGVALDVPVGGLELGSTAVTATAAELNYLDQSLAAHTLTRGTGVDGSEGYHASIARVGGIIVTQIYVNIDDLVISATDLDILGESATANCHWGQITTAKSGTIFGGKVTCLEVPTGGSADLDFYSSDVATGTEDVIITDAALGTETALVTAGGAWTLSAPTKAMSGLPTANDYIYITNGAASGNGTFTAGKFLIELYGV